LNANHAISLPRPRRALAMLYGTGFLLAALACSAASAETYAITTRTEGSAGNFNLPGLFPQGDLSGVHTYQLSVTSVFDSASVLPGGDSYFMQATDADLRVSLTLDGVPYSLQTTGTVRSQLLLDTDGDGRTTKRFYQSISFDPATSGELASIQQYVFLGADSFIINSVLQPGTAFYADPLTKGFSIYDWDVPASGPLVQLGDAGGRAEAFHYQLALVPEPATYAMLGAGLGLLGFSARRRS
jgi:hypothetical protein